MVENPYNETSKVLQDIAQATAQIRNEHQQETSSLQRGVDRLTGLVGWPGSVVLLASAIGVWVAINLLHTPLGIRKIDTAHFAGLHLALAVGAAFVAVLILTTQRRADQLAGHRLQLTLELVITIDRKISKIIELIEEQRRDSPGIADRVDGEANTMSTPSDASAVLKAIKDSTDDDA